MRRVVVTGLGIVSSIGNDAETVTQSLLSAATKVDPMTTSQALRSLEQKRLITRRTPKADLRVKDVQLTSRGRRVAFETIARLAKTHETFFTPLKDDNRRVVDYLRRLIEANDLTQ